MGLSRNLDVVTHIHMTVFDFTVTLYLYNCVTEKMKVFTK